MKLEEMLATMIEQGGSDLYLTCDAPPCLKVEGKLVRINDQAFTSHEVDTIAREILDNEQHEQFVQSGECNLALAYENLGRFRVNVFRQRLETGMVIRHIKTDIPELDSLGLPDVVHQEALKPRGLMLVVGGTGSGKTTSMAALIDHRNRHRAGHIVTIEDPIEFIHPHRQSLVTQREIGTDTTSYHEALKNTLRQSPDAILIGEIRSRDTMEHALAFAETGHLCLATLHANNANQAIDRILHFFPEEMHRKIQLDLALNLGCIISQRLINNNRNSRTLGAEILLNTALISSQIRNGQSDLLKDTMEKSENLGMQTFDGALYQLVQNNQISTEEALSQADSANNLRLRLKLSGVSGQKESSSQQRFRIQDK